MKLSPRFVLFGVLVAFLALAPLSAAAQREKKGNSDGLPTPVVNSMPDEPSAEAPHDAPTGDSRFISLNDPTPQVVHPRGNINSLYAEGIDISHHQHHIDWDQVATEPISYVYIKATEGRGFVDERYQRNVSEAHRIGLSVGSYHFYRPNVDWQEQFVNMISIVKVEEQDLVPLIDVEDRGRVSESKFIGDLKLFVEAVERHYGKRPLIYSGQNFYNKYLSGHFPHHQFMIARYNSDRPYLADGKNYIIWQYSEQGRVPGIRTNVDRSRIIGDFSLRELGM